ncbi:MAG: DUF1730 domain-containing protein [Oscillospiraceae bacterium]|nr:DUF1730 domain-containing protein [Oscillospiraceae bacterium]
MASDILTELRGLLLSRGVEHFGVCAFGDVLPLIDCAGAKKLPENPKSVVVCLFPFYTGEYEKRNVARFAAVPDYHRAAGGILAQAGGFLQKQTGAKFAAFTDNSPIREVNAARLAGLGCVGRNGLLINRVYGPYIFIGAVVTDLQLEPSAPGGSCPGCGECIRACPTSALGGEKLDRARCRSFITQKTGELTDWERGEIAKGGMVWGCDICADACPLGKNTPITPIPEFLARREPYLTPENLDALHPDMPYNYRSKQVLRRNMALCGAARRTAQD